ncbi:MAG: hypothetical protein DHS20C11_24460 [Lysobacteraceae bacterium]|nr:MAG: hypothetical protein DHS20C11_24460 [Xanthomonadaceae bacterium]
MFRTTLRVEKLVIATLLLAVAAAASAQQTYQFIGQTYNSVSGTYPPDGNIEMSFTVPAALAPNLNNADISAQVTSYLADDSVRTYDPTDSEILRFWVTTDAIGNITSYSISLYEVPRTTVAGEFFEAVDIGKEIGIGSPGCDPFDPGCSDSFCQENAGDVECTGTCDSGIPLPPGGNWGQNFDIVSGVADLCPASGFLPISAPAPARAVPSISMTGLGLLSMLMLALGLIAVRQR